MKKIILSFFWVACLLVTIPVANVFAKEESFDAGFSNEIITEEIGNQSQNVEIVKPDNAIDLNVKPNDAIDLQSAKGTSTTFEEAYWYINEKGEEVQVTKLKVSQADKGKLYNVSIDLEKNEYSIEESRSLISPVLPLATYEYTMGAAYTTYDPVQVALNRSKHEITWFGNSTDAGIGTRNGSAWAANPSSLGTHWFVDENRFEGYVDEGKYVISSSYHSYYNWDFGLDSKRTDVWHRLILQGYNDGYTYITAQNGKSGEGSSLLSFQFRNLLNL